ncbi:MAG: F0F1 ATP synthase subunit delta, partial [Aeriscardovia sp.]|nr:F0F1 ATP synthase subunit delta [Aeriscardovia sp.]
GEGRYSSRLGEDIEAVTSSLGEAGIEVRSASPLSLGQVEALKAAFAKKLGRPVHLRQIADPSLVGGFTVRSGAEVTDMSAGSQLQALKSAVEEKMAFCAKI